MAESGASVWYPAAGPGKLVGALLLLGLGLPAIFVLFQFIVADAVLARIVWAIVFIGLLVAVLIIGYLLRGLHRMRYVLTAYHLRIEWQRESLVIPYSGMEAAIYRREQPVRLPGREPYWPGYYIATIPTAEGAWRSVATVRPRHRVRIVTATGTISISPDRPIRFLHELNQRREAALAVAGERPQSPKAEPEPAPPSVEHGDGTPDSIAEPVPVEPFETPSTPTIQREEEPDQPAERRVPSSWSYAYRQLFRRELLADRISSDSIALAIIILVLMTIYTVYSIDNQFTPVAIHWDAGGEPDRIVQPRGLWLFPLMAGVMLVVNTALATLAIAVDRFVARLLVAATLVVQLVVAAALWGVLH